MVSALRNAKTLPPERTPLQYELKELKEFVIEKSEKDYTLLKLLDTRLMTHTADGFQVAGPGGRQGKFADDYLLKRWREGKDARPLKAQVAAMAQQCGSNLWDWSPKRRTAFLEKWTDQMKQPVHARCVSLMQRIEDMRQTHEELRSVQDRRVLKQVCL